jgi:hypothetical protein
MQTYLPHLLTDLRRAAACPPPAPAYFENPHDFPVPDYILEWEQAKTTPLSELFGIPAEALPPAGQWTEPQLETLVAAFIELWRTYGCDPSFPEGVTTATKDEQFRRHWDYAIDYTALSGGTFDFCDCEPNSCPYGEHCPCLDIELEAMDGYVASGGDELPF